MKIVVSARSLQEAKADCDVVELRLDLFDRLPAISEVEAISKEKIVTVRRKDEGGLFEGSEEERLELMRKYATVANYVDVECDAHDDFFDMPCKIIESYHNFSETPPFETLRDMIEGRRGDIFKIATLGRDKRDVLTIVRILCEYDNVVAFLMGEKFAYTRILAVMLGSPFIYCHAGNAVAPGQLEAGKARKILEMLL
ncbi:type I 3-dehydroquinate dehydratase [Archaeoglobus veneficus]|uniref:3-dehydroquinate dehydratase n=1 Tax=Archaeoglobus veneficus (strain DSM 11195 / SNP6) TaxID=693661 RepID=F2KPV7_ARCVS|nr:type I 3-dehydroquinate dehydratase [Archaeoglobus veneficus]AEA46464.1 3-dehydroquinate dehydratase [Archaeoglobus veneficus SNP6]